MISGPLSKPIKTSFLEVRPAMDNFTIGLLLFLSPGMFFCAGVLYEEFRALSR
jgi:hypothetical protein